MGRGGYRGGIKRRGGSGNRSKRFIFPGFVPDRELWGCVGYQSTFDHLNL
jgi:hypothetical protein